MNVNALFIIFFFFLISHILLDSLSISFVLCIPCMVFQLLASQQLWRLDESKGECVNLFFFFFAGSKRKMLPLCVLRQYNKGRNYALGNSSYCPQIDLFSSKQPNVTYLKLFLLSIFSNIIFTKKREIKISSIILQHSIICKLLSQSFQMTSQLINIFFIFLGPDMQLYSRRQQFTNTCKEKGPILKCRHKIMDKKTIYKFKCGFMTKKNNLKNKLANIKLNIFHLLGYKNVVEKNQKRKVTF